MWLKKCLLLCRVFWRISSRSSVGLLAWGSSNDFTLPVAPPPPLPPPESVSGEDLEATHVIPVAVRKVAFTYRKRELKA